MDGDEDVLDLFAEDEEGDALMLSGSVAPGIDEERPTRVVSDKPEQQSNLSSSSSSMKRKRSIGSDQHRKRAAEATAARLQDEALEVDLYSEIMPAGSNGKKRKEDSTGSGKGDSSSHQEERQKLFEAGQSEDEPDYDLEDDLANSGGSVSIKKGLVNPDDYGMDFTYGEEGGESAKNKGSPVERDDRDEDKLNRSSGSSSLKSESTEGRFRRSTGSLNAAEDLKANKSPMPSPDKKKAWTVHVSNMPWWMCDEDLVKAVRDTGVEDLNTTDIRFAENKVNGKSKGVAFLEFERKESAQAVINMFSTHKVEGAIDSQRLQSRLLESAPKSTHIIKNNNSTTTSSHHHYHHHHHQHHHHPGISSAGNKISGGAYGSPYGADYNQPFYGNASAGSGGGGGAGTYAMGGGSAYDAHDRAYDSYGNVNSGGYQTSNRRGRDYGSRRDWDRDRDRSGGSGRRDRSRNRNDRDRGERSDRDKRRRR